MASVHIYGCFMCLCIFTYMANATCSVWALLLDVFWVDLYWISSCCVLHMCMCVICAQGCISSLDARFEGISDTCSFVAGSWTGFLRVTHWAVSQLTPFGFFIWGQLVGADYEGSRDWQSFPLWVYAVGWGAGMVLSLATIQISVSQVREAIFP